MKTSYLYLGIDAGGSGTTCVLVDEDGCLKGRGVGPAANFAHLEPEKIVAAVAAAHQEALQAAGTDMEAVARAHVCMAGYGHSDEQRARNLLDTILRPAATTYSWDLDAALASVCGAEPGLVVIAGTGSVAYGRTVMGESIRVGGWGYLVGDEGSGYWLGAAALRLTLQALDGRRRQGLLVRRVCDEAKVASAVALRDRVYREGWRAGEIAAFAPLVTAAAEAGDPDALELVEGAAHELAALIQAALAQPNMPQDRCGLVGGLWKAGPVLTEPFRRTVQAVAPSIQLVRPLIEPAAGAALLALHAAGFRLRPDEIARNKPA
ncbi:MAG: hypothetical protein M3Y56_08605 [Armatimonadota bacterium]|nr:hypothetical protein [Armatimonadota bacterium]